MVEIIFKNKTTRITRAEVTINGNKFVLKGQQAKDLAKMANSDKTDIKKYIEELLNNINK